jgi:hypothetical protein
MSGPACATSSAGPECIPGPVLIPFSMFFCLGSISVKDRHQRHQETLARSTRGRASLRIYSPGYISFNSGKSCLYRFGSSVMRRSACANACDPMMKSASKRLGPCCAVLRRGFAYRANRRPPYALLKLEIDVVACIHQKAVHEGLCGLGIGQ